MGIVSRLLWPDERFDGFGSITPEFLRSQGVSALICDIDNTLVTYDDPEPTEQAGVWLREMLSSGIRIAFVSNNKPARVELFNRSVGAPAYGDAGKPKRKYLDIVMSEMGKNPEECAVLGDQLFTDVFSGKRVGTKAYLVPPIKDKKTLLFRFKRALEKPILKAYERSRKKK